MNGIKTKVGAGATLAALGGLAAYALGSGDQPAASQAAKTQPVEVRTETIRQTVRVVKREKPHHPRRKPHGSASAGSAPRQVSAAAAPAAVAAAAPPASASHVTTRSSGSAAAPAPVRHVTTRSSGSAGTPATTHHVTTRSSGSGGGEHEHEHEGGGDD